MVTLLKLLQHSAECLRLSMAGPANSLSCINTYRPFAPLKFTHFICSHHHGQHLSFLELHAAASRRSTVEVSIVTTLHLLVSHVVQTGKVQPLDADFSFLQVRIRLSDHQPASTFCIWNGLCQPKWPRLGQSVQLGWPWNLPCCRRGRIFHPVLRDVRHRMVLP